jgi:protein ImuA
LFAGGKLDPCRQKEQNKNMSNPVFQAADLDSLRRRIQVLERPTAMQRHALAFGTAEIDGHLPDGGLRWGGLHEVGGGGPDGVIAACATLFTAGILARMGRPILWCSTGQDLFAQGLACAGLHPDRAIHARADSEKAVLLVMEEALRHPGLSAVVGELSRLQMTPSRRLVLAAEKSGVMAIVLRRRKEGAAEDAGLTAAATRWRITPLPSAKLPAYGIGRARWQIELTRCRGADQKTWIMEACDAQGRLAVPAELAYGPAAQVRAGRAA